MHLHSLQLTDFKNHSSLSYDFSAQLNIVTGLNGTGKTNLLDAIHFLCNTKSAFLSADYLAIQHEQPFFRIDGYFSENKKSVRVECVCQKEGGKTFMVDGKVPEKLSTHIGRFPVVMVSPYDTDLVREGSETRRKFFDLMLSQASYEYLDKLMTYNRLLKQRNASLKQFAETGRTNTHLLSVYDEQLLPLNKFICAERSMFVRQFLPLVLESYATLAETAEIPHIEYRSECTEESFEKRFLDNQRNDLVAQRTSLGIHTDDYEFTFDQAALKRYGSQGQQKTFVLALKLAHFAFLLATKQKKPLLLLDDIFDRLDPSRVSNLTKMIVENSFAQVFITDADPKRIAHLFEGSKKEMAIFRTQE